MDIYQNIWEADMKSNGIRPILPGETRNMSEGYVVVDKVKCTPEHHVLKEVHIPDRKRQSYALVEKLFDNYTLDQYNKEKDTRRERREVKEFLTMAIKSSPVQMARKFVEETLNKSFTVGEWYTYLHRLWFRSFDLESGKDISGFEHIFIGEQKRKKLSGHHFWYKYWLEDNAELNNHRKDQIELKESSEHTQELGAPYVLTVSYRLHAFDYEKRRFVKISKNHCGFFVGVSAEGILALGTIRALFPENAPHYISFNDTPYKLELYMSPDRQSIRSFYPFCELASNNL